MEKKVIELFAGVGGFRCGLNNVELSEDGKTIENGNWDFVWANQWEPSTKSQAAFDCYVKRFGESKNHVNEDISTIDKATIPNHTLLCGGFPCLTADTLVLTNNGYKRIIDVSCEERVLTHDNKYHNVLALLNQGEKEIFELSSYTCPSLHITKNHLLYVRKVENGELKEPEWLSIEDLMNNKDNYLLGVGVNGHSKVLKYKGLDLSDITLWSAIGKYLATNCEDDYSYFPKTYMEEILKEFLKLFGEKDNINLPGFVFDLPIYIMKSFLESYLKNVDFETNNYFYINTDKFTYAILQCIAKVYTVPAIVEKEENYYRISFKKKLFDYENCYYLNRTIWTPINEIRETGLTETVYDLTVEEAHSFTANSCIVHNCQDYSVAKTSNNAKGIEGKKGVLWWQIVEILETKKPAFVLLENVDRLLISPSKQRGRDFAVMLRTFYDLGYTVQWQVINAAEYGFPQKRKRIFIFACREDTKYFEYLLERRYEVGLSDIVEKSGIFSKTFPVEPTDKHYEVDICNYPNVLWISENYKIPFLNSGCMLRGIVYTADTKAVEISEEEKTNLKDIIVQQSVAQNVFLSDNEIERFRYLKGSKRIPRTKPNGDPYIYAEGKMAFPDNLDVPARTMLTSEGTVNRSSHVVEDFETKQLRYLLPMEAERINCFPDNWTDTGMTQKKRYFMMGNALVVGIIKKLNEEIERIVEQEE